MTCRPATSVLAWIGGLVVIGRLTVVKSQRSAVLGMIGILRNVGVMMRRNSGALRDRRMSDIFMGNGRAHHQERQKTGKEAGPSDHSKQASKTHSGQS